MNDPIDIAKAINYHSDNLTHIMNCDQCKDVKIAQVVTIFGLMLGCVIGMLLIEIYKKCRKKK